jgi:hypothetical protein
MVCCFDSNKKARAKAIVPAPKGINMNIQRHIQKYIVESSGDLLLVSRFRGGHFYSKFYSFEEEFDCKENESNDEDPKDDFEDENSQDDVEDEGTKDESDRKDINDKPYVTIRFKVQKLERCTQEGSEFKYKWVKVDSLGDQILFVGDSSSLSLTASSLNGIKPNCINFTDDDLYLFSWTHNGGGSDMGVFSMEDATIKPHYSCRSHSFFCSPLWYI